MMKDLGRLLKDETELAGKFEKLPKGKVEEAGNEAKEASKEFEAFQEKWNKWSKGKVDELTKLPSGFVDDFGLRQDVKRVFEEIEKAANRPKAGKMEVALEDLGAGLATKMLEDLEMWMPDAADATKWALEEPVTPGGMKIPEMPLPDKLEDLVGDLLQKADEFDEEADDITSAWGDNLNQAGWGVGDGPISSFSAKGKTGNDLPNNNELSGRSGDGRRGKSSGQMVGNTPADWKAAKLLPASATSVMSPAKSRRSSTRIPAGRLAAERSRAPGESACKAARRPILSRICSGSAPSRPVCVKRPNRLPSNSKLPA